MQRFETELIKAMEGDAPPTTYERSYWVVRGKFLARAYPGDVVQEKAEANLRIHHLRHGSVRRAVGLGLSGSGTGVDGG